MEPPKQRELERFRQYRVRVFLMSRVLIEMFFYLTFAWSLMVICYGRRDTGHFWMTDGLNKVFNNFKTKVKPLYSKSTDFSLFTRYLIVNTLLQAVTNSNFRYFSLCALIL